MNQLLRTQGRKKRKKVDKNNRSNKLALLEHLHACGDALVAGTRARRGIAFSATLAPSLASLLDSIFEAVFARAKRLGVRGEKKVHRLQEGAGGQQGCDKTVKG